MDKIKSSFFIRIIFKYFEEKKKLELVKYNKILQKEININLANYKIMSGRYIIKEKGGKAKEYNGYDNKLLYDGEYLNWKRNGKGKEYDSYRYLTYEGEYINGKRNGKGKIFSFGKLVFEGEYLSGEKSGKCKEYYFKIIQN